MKEHHRSNIRYRRDQGFDSRTSLNCFSGFLFATAKVAYITAMIFLHIILHTTVHIYDFHIFTSKYKRLCSVKELPTWLFLSLMFAVFCNQSPLLTMLCFSSLSYRFIHSKSLIPRSVGKSPLFCVHGNFWGLNGFPIIISLKNT